jgi:hypothetical protein
VPGDGFAAACEEEGAADVDDASASCVSSAYATPPVAKLMLASKPNTVIDVLGHNPPIVLLSHVSVYSQKSSDCLLLML